MAPPKALGWAQRLVTVGPSGDGQSPPKDTDPTPPTLGSGPRDNSQPAAQRERPGVEPSAEGPDVTRPARPLPHDTSGPAPAPFIEEIYRRLPERPNDEGPTRGILTMPDGSKPVSLISGTKGPGAGAPGLTGRTALLDVARIHTEGHAAALMRRLGAAREMTLYLNNKPCQKRWGCAKTLKYQLPPGAKLTIYYPGGHDVFIGEEGQPE
ncbi:DddA-like double-stranded DNA deaminase toxin [Kribbella sp. NPDC056345]|uniref:DddA-like double-stranded DNA deaminase toxin n=1 Tax=Kribbella sp. NPDC056345 TaxID=3345789 RepID=UPI0035D84859